MATSPQQLGIRPLQQTQDGTQQGAEQVTDVQEGGEPEQQEVALDPVALKAQVDRQAVQLAELTETNKNLWSRLPTSQQQPPPPQQMRSAVATKRPPLPKDFTARLFDTDPDKVAEAMDEMLVGWAEAKGMISKDEAATMMGGQLDAASRRAMYFAQNPDLVDESSQTYKDAVRYGQQIFNDPDFRNLPQPARERMAMEYAIRDKRVREAAATGATKQQQEAARVKKIQQQTGPTRTAGKGPSGGGPQTELTREQAVAARQWGVTPEQYLKSLNRGVHVGPNADNELSREGVTVERR